MTSVLRNSLLASVSAAALTLMAVSPASAFDRVNWTWDAEILETVNKNVNIDINLEPTGMVMVEDLQVMIGDVTATSTVYGIENNQPSSGGTVDLGTLDVQFNYALGGGLLDDGTQSPEVVDGFVDETDQEPNINGNVMVTLDLGEVEVPPTDSYDALTELPEVISAATAVANNTSITSDASIQLHEGQFAFNVLGEDSGSDNGIFVPGAGTENSNLTAAGVLGVLALTGNIAPSQIEATSEVYDILNATVDSSATAVANNLTVNVEAEGPDRLVIADIVQFAFADVTATSSVYDISLNQYTNLGSLDRPIVNSIATAVGNNKSITVTAPVVSVGQ